MHEQSNLPADFDAIEYLKLNPDVAAAGVSAAEHYLSYGKSEGRKYRLSAAKEASGQFTSEMPSARNAVDIFAGEWSSKIPGFTSGLAGLFDDVRIKWMDETFHVAGKTVLELGPLEGGHSYMMNSFHAKSIFAIEGNKRAFLRCLLVKDLFDLSRVKFQYGDFMKYLDATNDNYDVAIASGVLYHMAEPLKMLSNLMKVSNRIFIWTHIYNEELVATRPDVHLFSSIERVKYAGHSYDVCKKLYADAAIGWTGFSGGPDTYAVWLTRSSLVGFFTNAGYKTTVAFEDLTHPNGAAMAICAWKS